MKVVNFRSRNWLKGLVCFAVIFLFKDVSAQVKYTLNGYIKDSTSGESIISATISVNGKSITSNQYGFYSITLEEGEYDVLVSHVTYLAQSFHVGLHSN